jgi:hypothetical protein
VSFACSTPSATLFRPPKFRFVSSAAELDFSFNSYDQLRRREPSCL